jgi:hypothetical protein
MKTTLFLSTVTAGLLAISTTTFAQNLVVEAQDYGDADRAQQGSNYAGPTDAYGSAIRPTRENRREIESTPSGSVVTDPETGQIIGADPDPEVRLEMRRDPPSDRGQ